MGIVEVVVENDTVIPKLLYASSLVPKQSLHLLPHLSPHHFPQVPYLPAHFCIVPHLSSYCWARGVVLRRREVHYSDRLTFQPLCEWLELSAEWDGVKWVLAVHGNYIFGDFLTISLNECNIIV